MEKLVPGVGKAHANFRWSTTPTSTIEMRFSEHTRQPSANLPFGSCSGEWLTNFETPASNNNMQNSASHNNSTQISALQRSTDFGKVTIGIGYSKKLHFKASFYTAQISDQLRKFRF